MISVRQYCIEDKEKIHEICLSDMNVQGELNELQKFVLIIFCDYYLEQESSNCFVAVDDESNEIIGYILCSENYEKYEKSFNEFYLPLCEKLGESKYVAAKLEMIAYGMYKSLYPAHIQCGVDKDYQRMGVGTLLLSTIKAHLKKKNIYNFMTICSPKNTVAIEFFKKNGFKSLITTKVGLAMSIEGNKDDYNY